MLTNIQNLILIIIVNAHQPNKSNQRIMMYVKNLALFIIFFVLFCQTAMSSGSLTLEVEDNSYTLNGEEKSFETLSQTLKSISLYEIEVKCQTQSLSELSDREQTLKVKEEKLLSDFLGLKEVSKTVTCLSFSDMELNDGVVALVGGLRKLKTLSFEECSVPLTMRHSSFSTLTNLTNFRLTNSKFNFEIDTEISFNGIMRGLNRITSLTSLDFGDNMLFPPVKKQKEFGRKKENKLELKHYMSWRKNQIDEGAKLFVTNLRVRKLDLNNTNLGELFIEAFIEAFSTLVFSRSRIEINLSKNCIPLNSAINFSVQLRDRNIKVNFAGNKGENDPDEYNVTNINQGIVAHFLTMLELDQD